MTPNTLAVVSAARRLSKVQRIALWTAWGERAADPDCDGRLREFYYQLAALLADVHAEAKAAAEAVFAEAVEAVLRADFADVEFLDAEGREIDPFT